MPTVGQCLGRSLSFALGHDRGAGGAGPAAAAGGTRRRTTGKQAAEPATSPALATTRRVRRGRSRRRRRGSRTTRRPARSSWPCGIPTGCSCSTRTRSGYVARSACPARSATCRSRRWAARCWCRARRPTRSSRSTWPPDGCGRPTYNAIRTTRPAPRTATCWSATSSAARCRSYDAGGWCTPSPTCGSPAACSPRGTSRSRSTSGTTPSRRTTSTPTSGWLASGREGTDPRGARRRRRIAVTDTRGDQVLLYTLDPLKQVGSITLKGSPYGVAGDPTTSTAWVTLTGSNRLVGLDVSGDQPKVIASYPTCGSPTCGGAGAKTLGDRHRGRRGPAHQPSSASCAAWSGRRARRAAMRPPWKRTSPRSRAIGAARPRSP